MQDFGAMYQLLLSPMTWGLLLALLLLLGWTRWGLAFRAITVVLLLLVVVLWMPLGGNALIGHVEAQVPHDAFCQAPDAPIVVMGGGFDEEPRAVDDYAALTQPSWRRLHGAVTLWRANPAAQLVIAGGGPFQIKESQVLAHLARAWGVPSKQVRTEAESTTTWESAMALRGSLPARIRLVSSAEHLPRALMSFRAAGFTPCVVASDSMYVEPGGVGYYLPQISGVEKSETAIYELVGMLSYRQRVREQSQAAAAR